MGRIFGVRGTRDWGLELGLGFGRLRELVTHTGKIQIQNQSVCHTKYVTSSSYHNDSDVGNSPT